MNSVINLQHISKQYRLGQVGTGTISHDLNRWWYQVRGKEDPYLKIGEANDRTQKGASEYVWALRDISFDVNQGEVLGIVGRNGAGKSTLLKILSRTTAPSTGKIKIKGRVASLLEVGTGFHPEMTGRENIFLNGAILGMTKQEITRKFDEIVDFAGVERYIDTPVKRYSSGMYVRLAFGVAAHLESEILIVDEVLAVGDMEFQKKCLSKMSDISKGQGRTILFVSHNMQAVATLCNRLVLIKNGSVEYDGKVNEGLGYYLKNTDTAHASFDIREVLSKKKHDEVFELLDLKVEQDGSDGVEFINSKSITLTFTYKVKKDVTGLRVGFDLIEKTNEIILFRTYHDDAFEDLKVVTPGVYQSKVIIAENFLKQGTYLLNLAVGIHNLRWIIYDEIKIEINITNIGGINKLYADERPGLVMPDLNWENKIINS